MRLVPFGVAGAGGDDARLRVGRLHGAAAGGTGQGIGRERLSGLSLESLIEHLPGQNLADLNGQFFEVAEVALAGRRASRQDFWRRRGGGCGPDRGRGRCCG
jgi:hypothetical protein